MDHDTVTAFLGRFVGDLGATGTTGAVVIGARLGLYRALADGAATPERFAERTGCHPRYLTEWLRGQAAAGYVTYDPATGEFSLTPEQAFCLADPNGPTCPRRASPCSATCAPNRASPRRSAPARESAGTSTTTTSSSGATRSTGPATSPSWCRTGSPRWRGRREADGRGAGRRRRLRPRVVVGAARPGLPAEHRRRPRLPRRVDRAGPEEGRGGRASRTGSRSRWPPRRPSRAPATTW